MNFIVAGCREFADIEVVAEGLAFPEGPVMMPDGSVAVVEMLRGVVSRCEVGGPVTPIADVGGGPNGAAFGPDGKLYVCNNGGSGSSRRPAAIQRVDLESGSVDDIYTECDGAKLEAPNDIVFDSVGGFWFTDIRGSSLYYALTDGTSIRKAVEGALTPNGVGLSPDGSELYWAQTYNRQIVRRRLACPGAIIPSPGYSIESLLSSGSVDKNSLVIGLSGGQELDSLAIEEGGNICVGTLVESGITVVHPDGFVVEKFVLPAQLADGAVTNICFGGVDMCTAFVSSSLAGRLISCRWPRPGLRLAF